MARGAGMPKKKPNTFTPYDNLLKTKIEEIEEENEEFINTLEEGGVTPQDPKYNDIISITFKLEIAALVWALCCIVVDTVFYVTCVQGSEFQMYYFYDPSSHMNLHFWTIDTLATTGLTLSFICLATCRCYALWVLGRNQNFDLT
jgi:hypothetical protein